MHVLRMNYFWNKTKYLHFSILVPLLVFTFLFLPFVDTPTCWDAGAEFSMTQTFYTRGIREFSLITVAHPPFKPILVSLFYKIGGFNTLSYNLVGLILGYLGIIGIYLLSKSLFNKNIAWFAAILLSTSPLFLANGINNLNDYLLTVLIILSLYFYLRKKLFLYIIVTSAAVLTKETAALFPMSVLVIDIFFYISKRQESYKTVLIRFFVFLIPLLLLFLWNKYAQLNGRSSDWWMTPGGAYMAILKNVITLNIFTKYTWAHISKLLFLNFNWIYWIILIIGTGLGVKNLTLKKIKKWVAHGGQKEKTICVMFLFFISYVLTVLTFQIPAPARYHLVLIPAILIGTSYIIGKYIPKKLFYAILFLLGVLNFVRLFFSVDPISIFLWDKENIGDEQVYSKSVGDDQLVYNLQYLFILKQRRNEIKSKNKNIDWNNSYFYTLHCSFRS